MITPSYWTAAERAYCQVPEEGTELDVLFIGAAVGLASARYLLDTHPEIDPSRVGVLEEGPFDLITHVANTRYERYPLMREGFARLGGRLAFWGVSTPRPPSERRSRWPYDPDDLDRRFHAVEAELGVHDPTPMSGRQLERDIQSLLERSFPGDHVRPAPLAIDLDGVRWSPLGYVPDLARRGVRFFVRSRCEQLLYENGTVRGVRVERGDGTTCTLRPRFVVLAVGLPASLPLLRDLPWGGHPLEASDHIRIDLHGSLLGGSFGARSIDASGVCILLQEFGSPQAPCHLEVKVAPKQLWQRNKMQSSDNLNGDASDETLFVQVQAVAGMHDRLPESDLLNLDSPLAPVMSRRDAVWHGEIVQRMSEVADVLGLPHPTFCLRPLLENHHLYGAFRVGGAVGADFRFGDSSNLYVLPPASYVDEDDDANPTLKSLVLSQYAMDSIAVQVSRPASARGIA